MRQPTDKIRIALIGLGDIAIKAYLPIIANHTKVEPILSTRNMDTLSVLAEQYRIKETYSNIDALIKAKPDAVMVHTSTESHYRIAKQIINAGIACFVDKPLSYYYGECEELVTLARVKNVPLYVGFNRRFAPLVAPLAGQANVHLRWQKNRVNLPEEPRHLIFNDFIHVVDGLRFLAKDSTKVTAHSLHVSAFEQQGLLANIHFQYKHNNTLIEGSMNRLSGNTEERLEAFSPHQKVEINSLTSGKVFCENQSKDIGFNDWQSYLYARGFVDMMEDWISVVARGFSSEQQLDDILNSHYFCEQLVKKLAS